MKPINDYKKWLKAVSEYYAVPEEDILNTSKRNKYISNVRIIFYKLCFRDKIDIYRLSEAFGKDRNSIWISLERKEGNKEIENKIIEKCTLH